MRDAPNYGDVGKLRRVLGRDHAAALTMLRLGLNKLGREPAWGTLARNRSQSRLTAAWLTVVHMSSLPIRFITNTPSAMRQMARPRVNSPFCVVHRSEM
jgi:hypothetical protein